MGKPIFSCGYANFAWGATAFGQVLDHRGQIWFYDLGKTWSPRPAGDGLYLESGLEERFAKAEALPRRVPPKQVAAMRKKAEAAGLGQIERTQRAFDKGGSGCEAYVWERSDAYRRVELGSVGDVVVRNSSTEAEQISKWLQDDLGMARGRVSPP